MRELNRKNAGVSEKLPEKVLMFGEGNFLRAFACFIVQKLNESGYGGGVVALQGLDQGLADMINGQDGLYTVIERGFEKGQTVERSTLITCLNRCVNPYADYEEYLAIAKNPELQVIISNTTEFGICYEPGERFEKEPHRNFPAKLTRFLYERFRHFGGDEGKGLTILSCELIDKNGEKLKEIVLRYAGEWGLESGFTSWLESSNVFANTLVDRIVSGYPKAEADKICEKIGYQDNLLDVCEPFLLWVIEADSKILKTFPLDKCGLDIVVTDDLTPYRTRKVRILNGAHTMSVLAGHLCGFEIVEQLVNDEVFYRYLQKGIYEEIISTFKGEKLAEYAADVLERFKNPYLNHKLLSISLNSVSKFKARVLPSIKDYIKLKGYAPRVLSFSLAALISFYKEGMGKFVNDDLRYIEEFGRIFGSFTEPKGIVRAVMQNITLWEEDLTQIPFLEEAVAEGFELIAGKGIKEAVREIAYGKGGNQD